MTLPSYPLPLPDPQDCHALLVCTSPTRRALILRALQALEADRCVAVVSGFAQAEAFAASEGFYGRRARPALRFVLLDWRADERGRAGFMRRLRGEAAYRDVVVVALVDGDSRATLTSVYEAGVVLVLRCPRNPKQALTMAAQLRTLLPAPRPA